MTQLKYIGPDPAEVGIVPLQEGWPAADHTEPDKALVKEKLASKMYEELKPERAEPSKKEG